jgi:AcrR family transcriptional regulator
MSKSASSRTRAPEASIENEAVSEALFRRVALELFAERGFHGTSLRDIAAEAGTNVSHLYYYFPSKADLLRSIMVAIGDALVATLSKAATASGEDPVARFSALVRAMVLFHAERRTEAFVGRSELRSLTDEARAEIVARYDWVTALFKDTLDAGVRGGVFRCEYPKQAVFSILAMSSQVATWYRIDGELAPPAIAERYATLALEMIGHGGLTPSS